MKYKLSIIILFFSCLVCAEPPKTYQIKLSYKDYPGKKYRLKKTDGTFYNRTHLNSAGKIIFTKSSNRLLEFEGDIQTIKINDKEKATEILITVLKCLFSDGGREAKLIFPNGQKVKLYIKDGKEVYEADDKILGRTNRMF